MELNVDENSEIEYVFSENELNPRKSIKNHQKFSVLDKKQSIILLNDLNKKNDSFIANKRESIFKNKDYLEENQTSKEEILFLQPNIPIPIEKKKKREKYQRFLMENIIKRNDFILAKELIKEMRIILLNKEEKTILKDSMFYIIYKGDYTLQVLLEHSSLLPNTIKDYLTFPIISLTSPQFFSLKDCFKNTYRDFKLNSLSHRAKIMEFNRKKFFEILENHYNIFSVIKSECTNFNNWLTNQLKTKEKLIKKAENNNNKRLSTIEVLNTQIKQKKRRRIQKIRASVPNILEKCSIIKAIHSENSDIPTFEILKMLNKTNSFEKETKVLQISSKNGSFLRGKVINPLNFKEIKRKFYPLSLNQINRGNYKKVPMNEKLSISDIKEKDPFLWGREQAMLQNHEKNCLNRLYTRKIEIIHKKFIGNPTNVHMLELRNNEKKSIFNGISEKDKMIIHQIAENNKEKECLPKISQINNSNRKKIKSLFNEKSTNSSDNLEEYDQSWNQFNNKLKKYGKLGNLISLRLKEKK